MVVVAGEKGREVLHHQHRAQEVGRRLVWSVSSARSRPIAEGERSGWRTPAVEKMYSAVSSENLERTWAAVAARVSSDAGGTVAREDGMEAECGKRADGLVRQIAIRWFGGLL